MAVMRIQATDPGFQAENVFTLRNALPTPRYDVTERRNQFYNGVLQGVRALPGVQSAAYVTGLPIASRSPGGTGLTRPRWAAAGLAAIAAAKKGGQ